MGARQQRVVAVTRTVVDGLTQTVVIVGAVAGVASLLDAVGPVACLAWTAALATLGSVAGAAWVAVSGDREPGAVRQAGWWLTVLLLACSLALTSSDLFVGMLPGVVLLVVVGLGLTAVVTPAAGGPAVRPAPEPAAPRG